MDQPDKLDQLFSFIPPSINCIVDPVDGKGGIYLGNISSTCPIQLFDYKINCVLTVMKITQTYMFSSNKEIQQHLMIPAEDDSKFDLYTYFNQACTFLEENLKKYNVLIHCFAGVSRSTTILIAYLMKKNKWTFQQSFEFVQKKRSYISPNEGFRKQLKDWEKVLEKQ